MSKSYFLKELGGYVLEGKELIGSRDYIYSTTNLLLKVDQFGPYWAQANPPGGISIFQRNKREHDSPMRVNFSFKGKVYNNFDIISASKVKITYLPTKSIYSLWFKDLEVETTLSILDERDCFVMRINFINHSDKDIDLRILPVFISFMSPVDMAPWDKPEWYTSMEYKEDHFLARHFSVAGKVEERRYLVITSNVDISNKELSYEALFNDTLGFKKIPNKLGKSTGDTVYTFEQVASWTNDIVVKANSNTDITICYSFMKTKEEAINSYSINNDLFDNSIFNNELTKLEEKYNKLFKVRSVKTPDKKFNNFVNGFLPLQMDWVSKLDRGWPTGMRGVRDASNDFTAFVDYNKEECRDLILHIFSKQRSDGWYPRQIPAKGAEKFDLRHYIDSACFFSEFVYEYIVSTNDFSIFDEMLPYYDSDLKEDGFTHYKKGLDYLMQKDSIGEHGLVKIQGGDWLDPLGGIGSKGRGESVMVSAQLIIAIEQLLDLTKNCKDIDRKTYQKFAKTLKENINKYSYNEYGYYNAIFTDEGDWLFSNKDRDGEKRLYIPTNAYVLACGSANKKQIKSVISNIAKQETKNGFALFTPPLGKKVFPGIGKLGTGDVGAGFAENGGIYNHGSHGFYLRGLAAVKDYKNLGKVLKYAMPIYHKESISKNASYAVTNCYHNIPSFEGRAMFSFLTGSIAVIIRGIYNWLYGINYTHNYLKISPCIPADYKDSEVSINGLHNLNIKYHGYGAKILSCSVNGEKITPEKGEVLIPKEILKDNNEIDIKMSL